MAIKAIIPVENPGVTIRVVSTPNFGQTWTITGPDGFIQSDRNDTTISHLPPGNYSVNWDIVAGYDPPSPPSEGPITVSSGTIQTFTTPVYNPDVGNGFIRVNSTGAPTGAQWTIYNDADDIAFTGSGPDDVTFAAAPDSYTIQWSDTVPGWVAPTPNVDPLVLVESQTITFTLADDPYVIEQGSITVDMTGAPADASWTLTNAVGGEYSGTSGTTISDAAANETYTMIWEDTAYAFLPPTVPDQTLAVGGSITFDLSTNYTALTTAGVQTDVDIQVATTGNWTITPGAPWTATNFAASGAGDVTDVTPSTGDFYEGRSYTISYAPEVGFTPPPNESWTAAVETKTLTGVYTVSGTANRDYDANGWLILNLPGGDKTVYVSESTGSDGDSGLTKALAKKTIAAGVALLTDNSGDHLLLRRGDTWTNEAIDLDLLSGRSRIEPLLVSSYDDGNPTDPRPKLNFTGGGDSIANGGVSTFKAYTDLDFEHTGASYGSLPDFGNSGFKSYVFEGCRWQHVTGGFQGPAVPGFETNDIEIHRCVFTDFGNDWYNKWWDNTKFTESIIDKGGPGHATYWVNWRNLTFDGNIVMRPNNTINGSNMKFSSNGEVPYSSPMSLGPLGNGYCYNLNITNNVYLSGIAHAISMGQNNDVTTPRWDDCHIDNNVIIAPGFNWESPGSPSQRNSDFLDCRDWNTGSVDGNLHVWGLRDEGSPVDWQTRIRFFDMGAAANPGGPGPYMADVSISNNIVTHYFQDSTSTAIVDFRRDPQNITFDNNIIQNTEGGAAPLVGGPPAGTNSFSGNTYYSVLTASNWFTTGNYASWQSATGDTGATILGAPQTWVEERTLEQYHEDVCNKVSGSFNGFCDDALTHFHKEQWDKDALGATGTQGMWSGTALNAWMKAGWTPV